MIMAESELERHRLLLASARQRSSSANDPKAWLGKPSFLQSGRACDCLRCHV